MSSIIVIIPNLLALAFSSISLNMYTWLAVCNCLSFTLRLGGFAIPSDGYFIVLLYVKVPQVLNKNYSPEFFDKLSQEPAWD